MSLCIAWNRFRYPMSFFWVSMPRGHRCDAGAAPELHELLAADSGGPPLPASRLPLPCISPAVVLLHSNRRCCSKRCTHKKKSIRLWMSFHTTLQLTQERYLRIPYCIHLTSTREGNIHNPEKHDATRIKVEARPPLSATGAACSSPRGRRRLVQTMARHLVCRGPTGRCGHGPWSSMAGITKDWTGRWARPGSDAGTRRERRGQKFAAPAVAARRP